MATRHAGDGAAGTGGASPQLLALVGGESTGKSTLAQALVRDLPGVQVPETLRAWVELHGRVPTMSEQHHVMVEHALAEGAALHLAARQGVPWAVSDSGPIMTAVYSVLYYDDASLVAEALQLTAPARMVIWCSDDIPWAADPMRDGPEARRAAQEVIAQVLSRVEVPWIQVSGSVADRVAQVRLALSADDGRHQVAGSA